MSRKLLILITFVVVLALTLPAKAAETLLVSYEPNDFNNGDLVVRVNDEAGNLTVKTTWPMLEGADACSYEPNFGPGVTVPNATDGNYVLGFSWTNETDNRADLHHEWIFSTFDCLNNDEIRIDVYIEGPNDMGVDRIDLWDDTLGWILGEFTTPITFNEWVPVTYDLTGVSSKNRLTDHWQIATIYFGGQASDDGRVFFDNLRLWSPFGPKPSSPSPGDAATGLSRGADLSWTQGQFAASHDIYFGTSAGDVNDANNSWPVPAMTSSSLPPTQIIIGASTPSMDPIHGEGISGPSQLDSSSSLTISTRTRTKPRCGTSGKTIGQTPPARKYGSRQTPISRAMAMPLSSTTPARKRLQVSTSVPSSMPTLLICRPAPIGPPATPKQLSSTSMGLPAMPSVPMTKCGSSSKIQAAIAA
jgi:hypothetical protein